MVFGQPPRSLIVPDPSFKGQIEEDALLSDDDYNEQKITRHPDSPLNPIHSDIELPLHPDSPLNHTHSDSQLPHHRDSLLNSTHDSESDDHSEQPKRPLATIKKHLSVRTKADEAYRKNETRMFLKNSKQNKVETFNVGQYISVRVPRIDRASTDPPRLPCVVVQVVGKAKALYRLRCHFGVLKVCYNAGDLEAYAGSYNIPVDGWEEDERITL